MPSELRKLIRRKMDYYADKLQLQGKDILDIGIAGDQVKPSDNYFFFGEDNTFKTLDKESKYKPDYVADITDMGFGPGAWDLVICSQVLEHVWNFKTAIKELYFILQKGGYLILQTPFYYPEHSDDVFKDYWRFTTDCYRRLLKDFTEVEISNEGQVLISALAKK